MKVIKTKIKNEDGLIVWAYLNIEDKMPQKGNGQIHDRYSGKRHEIPRRYTDITRLHYNNQSTNNQ